MKGKDLTVWNDKSVLVEDFTHGKDRWYFTMTPSSTRRLERLLNSGDYPLRVMLSIKTLEIYIRQEGK